jgi:excinuclease ABC subunit C
MRDAGMNILYVGKAKDLAKRVAQYFNPNKDDVKNQVLAPLVRKIDYIACSSEREALVWERRLISRHQPFFNSMWKDGKSYPFVKLSLQEDFPRLSIVRRKPRDGAAYFGPYPQVSAVRSLLGHLWRSKAFPLRPCEYDFSLENPLAERKIKACLYYHTRECPAPCAGRISPEAYRRIAEDARLFFSGRFQELKGRLLCEMAEASRALDFERAAVLRDNAGALEHMADRVLYSAVRPERVDSRLEASRSVTDLQKALGLARPPHHIECFDISHLSGREAVGSMACFRGGSPNKSHYRRFKIRGAFGIDDTASIAEVVGRRYRRLIAAGEEMPDLVLVDGGKGQLSAAEKALAEIPLRIPLAALAKREEEIHLPGRPPALRLERGRPALALLQRLRDEAHRFAVGYHRNLRGKNLFRGSVSLRPFRPSRTSA